MSRRRCAAADDLPFGDATFDSVSVPFGYMFFPDAATATAEFARVLKPGGRICSSVWVKPEDNHWTTILMQAIVTEVVLAPPDPDGPNMFRCAAPGHVSAVYEAAGLRDVAEWDVDVELVTSSPAEYWEMMSEHVSLAVAALQQVDEPARERIRATVISNVSAFEKDGKVRVRAWRAASWERNRIERRRANRAVTTARKDSFCRGRAVAGCTVRGAPCGNAAGQRALTRSSVPQDPPGAMHGEGRATGTHLP